MVSHLFNRLIAISVLLVSVYCERKSQKMEIMERDFVAHYGNDSASAHEWHKIQDWYFMPGEPSLRKFCAEVHELAGNGPGVVDYVFWRERLLQFRNSSYAPRKVEIVEYRIQGARSNRSRPTTVGSWELQEKGGKRWFITEGLEPGCVYFLKRINATIVYLKFYGAFLLEKHVCGVKDISPFTTPNIEELLKSVSPYPGGPGMNSEERTIGTHPDRDVTQRYFQRKSTKWVPVDEVDLDDIQIVDLPLDIPPADI